MSIVSTKPNAYILIGLPGSGKSTWAKNLQEKLYIIEYEAILDGIISSCQKVTLEEEFNLRKQAYDAMLNNIDIFKKEKKPFVLDYINLKKGWRKSLYDQLNSSHRVIFVSFKVPYHICYKRMCERNLSSGRPIYHQSIMSRILSYAVFPDESEQYDQLIEVKHDQWTGIEVLDLGKQIVAS